MTQIDILVIMDSGYEDIRRILENFVRPSADIKQAQKRERILTAATEMFVTYGYRKTSIDDVARAAGVAKGTVYLYYHNKAELLVHAIVLEELHYVSAFKPIFAASIRPAERLRGFIALGITWAHKLPLLAKFTGGDPELTIVLSEVDNEYLQKIGQLEVDFVARLLDDVVGQTFTPTVLQQRATALMELMWALVTSGRIMQHDMSLEEYADLMADVLVNGILHAPRLTRSPSPLETRTDQIIQADHTAL